MNTHRRDFASIGVGAFEFPLQGSFVVQREGGATTLEDEDQGIRYTVGEFASPPAPGQAQKEQQIAEVGAAVRANWEQFAEEESGEIVVPFRRDDLSNGATVFSMATEFITDDSTQYYVQFVATEGPRFVMVFAEGDGEAFAQHQRLLPAILSVRIGDDG